MTEADDGQKRIEKYLLENATPEAKPISKKPDPEKVKEQPKDDDFNEYDFSDDKELDDTQW